MRKEKESTVHLKESTVVVKPKGKCAEFAVKIAGPMVIDGDGKPRRVIGTGTLVRYLSRISGTCPYDSPQRWYQYGNITFLVSPLLLRMLSPRRKVARREPSTP